MKRPPRKAAFSFTEPVSLSSTLPGNLPLAGTAPGSRFDLLALRARCKGDSRPRSRAPQESGEGSARKLRLFLFALVEWGFFQRATAARTRLHAATCGKKFAEPGARSSTVPGDVPLPRTASRLGFDLLALRARRRQQPTCNGPGRSRPRATEKPALCDPAVRARQAETGDEGEGGSDRRGPVFSDLT